MKQYMPHPDRDEMLEFDVPDGAVYLGIGGTCPTCATGDRRVSMVDWGEKRYECATRIGDPGCPHDNWPRIRWAVRRQGDGSFLGFVYEGGGLVPSRVSPRVVSGSEYARSQR